MKRVLRPGIILLLILLCLALSAGIVLLLGPTRGRVFSSIGDIPVSPSVEVTMNLISPAFEYGQPIPVKYSCRGEDISPPLQWSEPPAGTRSFVLIMDDPDAPMGTWDHWLLFNIPPETRSLPENLRPTSPIRIGRNSWGKNAYGGPCPPSGTHRYFFRLYALDSTLDLPDGASKGALLTAMQGHILAQAEWMGTFRK